MFTWVNLNLRLSSHLGKLEPMTLISKFFCSYDAEFNYDELDVYFFFQTFVSISTICLYDLSFLSICLYDTEVSLGLYDTDISLGLYDRSWHVLTKINTATGE